MKDNQMKLTDEQSANVLPTYGASVAKTNE
jgi:hypothetical protein